MSLFLTSFPNMLLKNLSSQFLWSNVSNNHFLVVLRYYCIIWLTTAFFSDFKFNSCRQRQAMVYVWSISVYHQSSGGMSHQSRSWPSFEGISLFLSGYPFLHCGLCFYDYQLTCGLCTCTKFWIEKSMLSCSQVYCVPFLENVILTAQSLSPLIYQEHV